MACRQCEFERTRVGNVNYVQTGTVSPNLVTVVFGQNSRRSTRKFVSSRKINKRITVSFFFFFFFGFGSSDNLKTNLQFT